MTQQEHLLMMQLTGALFQFSMPLFEILRTRTDATLDDIPAFSALVEQGGATPQFVELYRKLAQANGIQLP